MLFEVLAETWEYRPRRCTLVVYKRGQRGFLPESVVLQAEADGFAKRLADG